MIKIRYFQKIHENAWKDFLSFSSKMAKYPLFYEWSLIPLNKKFWNIQKSKGSLHQYKLKLIKVLDITLDDFESLSDNREFPNFPIKSFNSKNGKSKGASSKESNGRSSKE